jgi:hypothetical protein
LIIFLARGPGSEVLIWGDFIQIPFSNKIAIDLKNCQRTGKYPGPEDQDF